VLKTGTVFRRGILAMALIKKSVFFQIVVETTWKVVAIGKDTACMPERQIRREQIRDLKVRPALCLVRHIHSHCL
jgi:hypothetical protein